MVQNKYCSLNTNDMEYVSIFEAGNLLRIERCSND